MPFPIPFVEERLGRPGHRRFVHAGAGIGDGQANVPAGSSFSGCSRSAVQLRAEIASIPPSGIASRALTQRLRTAHLDWLGSTQPPARGEVLASTSTVTSMLRTTQVRQDGA